MDALTSIANMRIVGPSDYAMIAVSAAVAWSYYTTPSLHGETVCVVTMGCMAVAHAFNLVCIVALDEQRDKVRRYLSLTGQTKREH